MCCPNDGLSLLLSRGLAISTLTEVSAVVTMASGGQGHSTLRSSKSAPDTITVLVKLHTTTDQDSEMYIRLVFEVQS
jgi:hypothetical protein